ncbi:hypothetical protein C7972_10185 [Arenibacter sp. ARW7G5Y1]|nr:hypothetical protein C7972_10185 [Arenibacter sp. ARW7G5Y1]
MVIVGLAFPSLDDQSLSLHQHYIHMKEDLVSGNN